MIEWDLFNHQNEYRLIIEGFILFREYLIITLVIIISGIIVFIFSFFGAQLYNWALVEGQFIETLSAIQPALALIKVALSFLSLLYNINISPTTHIT